MITRNPFDVFLRSSSLRAVLEYFSLSPWYDKTCLTSMFHTRASLFGEKMDPSILKKMEGLDYELAHHEQNRLFVVEKVSLEV